MTPTLPALTEPQERQLRMIAKRNAYDGEPSFVRHLDYRNGAAINALIRRGLVVRTATPWGDVVELTAAGRAAFELVK